MLGFGRCLGASPADDSGFWNVPDFWDADDLAMEKTDVPNIWTDGSREDCPVGVFEVAGAGVYLPAPELAVDGHGHVERCRALCLCLV